MDRLETGWRCRRRRNEGLAPVREEIGSKRVRPKSGRYFPAVGVLLSDPALGSRAEKGNGASRLASDGWELASLPPLRGKDRMGGRAMPARLASLAWEALRRNAANAERRLWQGLRRKEVGAFRFRRQVALGGFIADFASFDARLIIDPRTVIRGDGATHSIDEEFARDAARTAMLAAQGFAPLRFTNDEAGRGGQARRRLGPTPSNRCLLGSCRPAERRFIFSLHSAVTH